MSASVFYKDASANEVNYLDVSKIDKVVKKFLKSASKFELSGISVQSLSSIAYSTFSELPFLMAVLSAFYKLL